MRGMIDIPRRPAGEPADRSALDSALAERNTALCLVFGEGEDVDAVAEAADENAGRRQCRPVRVVRVRDDAVLTGDEAKWKPPSGKGLTLLRFDHTVSKVMTLDEASDDGDVFNAMIHTLARKPK